MLCNSFFTAECPASCHRSRASKWISSSVRTRGKAARMARILPGLLKEGLCSCSPRCSGHESHDAETCPGHKEQSPEQMDGHGSAESACLRTNELRPKPVRQILDDGCHAIPTNYTTKHPLVF